MKGKYYIAAILCLFGNISCLYFLLFVCSTCEGKRPRTGILFSISYCFNLIKLSYSGYLKAIWRQSGTVNLAIWRLRQSGNLVPGPIWHATTKHQSGNLQSGKRFALYVYQRKENIIMADCNLAFGPIWQQLCCPDLANLAPEPIWQSGGLHNLVRNNHQSGGTSRLIQSGQTGFKTNLAIWQYFQSGTD